MNLLWIKVLSNENHSWNNSVIYVAGFQWYDTFDVQDDLLPLSIYLHLLAWKRGLLHGGEFPTICGSFSDGNDGFHHIFSMFTIGPRGTNGVSQWEAR